LTYVQFDFIAHDNLDCLLTDDYRPIVK